MPPPEIPLASLSLTHVHYDPSDPLSYLAALLALTPQTLCLTYALLVTTTREVEIALLFAGQLACEALNILLKRVFKEARPERIRHLGKGYGMPSSHAQFVSFFAVGVGLFLFLRHRHAEGVGKKEGLSEVYRLQVRHPRLTHAVLAGALFALAGAVAWSRIYLGYHTLRQVVVGCACGTVCALAWFGVTEYLRRAGWVAWLLEWELLRKARVRDLICEEDLVEIGWRVWEDKRRARRALEKQD